MKLAISGHYLRNYSKPLVYIFWQETMALYIGSSKHGLGRPFEHNHGKARESMKITTCLELIICESLKEARHTEKLLIEVHKPKLNILHRK